MHAHPPDEQFISLSKAAKMTGVTPEHLNLLARQGKLHAEKIGRNWFTTKKWLDEYFLAKNADEAPADGGVPQARPAEGEAPPNGGSGDAVTRSADLALREIEKEEKVALAQIQADLQKRQIEKEEKLEITKLAQRHTLSDNPEPFIIRAVNSGNSHIGFDPNALIQQSLAGDVADQLREEIDRIAMEKKHLVEFFSRELGEIQDSRKQEKGERQALIFAFENLQSQVKEDIDRRIAEIAYQLNERLTEFIINTRQEQPQQPMSDLQEQAQTQINILRDEKTKLADLFINQLNQIKHKLHIEGQKKNKILEEFQKFKNDGPGIENSGEAPQGVRRQLDELKSNLATTLQSSTENKEAEELEQITSLRKKFSGNLRMFKVESEKTGQIRHFKTKFIARSNNQRESILNSRALEDRLQLSEWRVSALSPSGVHFIARHNRFDVKPDNTFDLEQPVVLRIFSPTFAWSALAVVLMALMIAPFFDSQISKKVSAAYTAVGTRELFVTRVGNELSNLIIDSVADLPVILSPFGFQLPIDIANVFSGGIDSGMYVLRGADFWLRAKSEEIESKTKNISMIVGKYINKPAHFFSLSVSSKLNRAQSSFTFLFSQPLVKELPSAGSDFRVGESWLSGLTSSALDQGMINAKQNLIRVFSDMINIGSLSALPNGELSEADDFGVASRIAGASTSAHPEVKNEKSESSVLGSTAQAIEGLVESYFKAVGSFATMSQEWLSSMVQGR